MGKNIVFFDLETTGAPKNPDLTRIIEISCIKTDENFNEIDTLYFKCSNDDVRIEPDAFARHGISEDELIGCPTFTEVAKKVYDFFDGCDVGGYYCEFYDAPILYNSFLRAGITWNFRDVKMYDVYILYKKYNSGKLGEVYKRYTGKDLENAHSADADTRATLEVCKVMTEQGAKFESDELDVYFNRIDVMGYFKYRILEDGRKEIFIDFGKHKGKAIENVEASYFNWIADNVEGFPIDTRMIARKIADKAAK